MKTTMQFVFATSLLSRLTGLLRRDCCANNEVLLLAPCKSIHSFGMRDSLDVAFLDAQARVLFSEREVLPAQIRSHPKAVAVLERRSSQQDFWPKTGEILRINSVEMNIEQKEGVV